jgi:Glycosyltransferases, probably involved in cell wall biogenesis
MKHYSVSVIVPIHNVGKYIERCAEALMNQTLESIEFIFVDDASPDNSMEVLAKVLERHPERKDDVRIIRHEVNKGLTQTRNDGLNIATGDFITHCDSDDWPEVTMYEKMYRKAVEEEAEMVICDFRMVFEKEAKCFHNDVRTDCSHENCVRSYICNFWNTVWSSMVSRKVYERSGARPPLGVTMCEDFVLTVELILSAGKVATIPEPLYNYNLQNTSSIIHGCDRPEFNGEELKSYLMTIEWMKERGCYVPYRREMDWRILKSIKGFVFLGRFKEFRKVYKGSLGHIFTTPDSYFGVKTKLMMAACRLHLDFLCRLVNRVKGRA